MFRPLPHALRCGMQCSCLPTTRRHAALLSPNEKFAVRFHASMGVHGAAAVSCLRSMLCNAFVTQSHIWMNAVAGSRHAVKRACPHRGDRVCVSAQGPQALDPKRAAAGGAVDGRGGGAGGARAQQVALLGRHRARQRRICRAGGRWAPGLQTILREGVGAWAPLRILTPRAALKLMND